jgi:hypothetical protein
MYYGVYDCNHLIMRVLRSLRLEQVQPDLVFARPRLEREGAGVRATPREEHGKGPPPDDALDVLLPGYLIDLHAV